jgi:hypothetical protein
MRSVSFTAADLEQMAHDRYHHPHPHVQATMEVLWLKSRGVGHTEIARLTGLSRNTVQRDLGEYSALHDHAATLEDYVLANPPRSTAEAQLDNARYQRAAAVKALATQLRIELLYLPG